MSSESKTFKYSTNESFVQFDSEAHVPYTILIFTSEPFYNAGIDNSLVEGQLRKMVENFNKGILGRKVPINYDHPATRMAESVAAGWVTELNSGKTESGHYAVYAGVEWNQSGRKKIYEREYLYTSIGAYVNYIDPKDGKTEHGFTLFELSLTNRPANLNIGAIKEFCEIGSQKNKGEEKMDEKKMVEFAEYKTKVETLTAENETMKAKVAEFSKLSADLEAREKQLAESEATLGKKQRQIELNKMVEEKKIIPAMMDKAIEMSEAAYEGFKTAIETLNGKAAFNDSPTSEVKNPTASEGMENKLASVELSEKAAALSEKKSIDMRAAFEQVLLSDKQLNDRYEKEMASTVQ